MTRPEIHINGKWLAQPVTGTQRYANEIVAAMLAEQRSDFILHVPAAAKVPDWLRRGDVVVRRSRLNGLAFEQLHLPLTTFGRMLLNFAGPAPLLKRKQLVTMHDATTFRFRRSYGKPFVAFYFVMYLLLSRSARHLVTVSRFSASELAAVLRIPADRFLVAGCAADAIGDVTPIRPQIAPDRPYYLTVGTPAVHKNLMAPVRAVVESGRLVVVVGASGAQQVYRATTSLAQGALIAGRLSDAELVWLYRNAQALIFPSKYEGFGLPVLEAQELGCPVLCSAAASLPEVAGDGALFFDPDDPNSLLAAVDTLESTTGLGDDLRRRGLTNSERHRWTVSAAAILDRVLGRTLLGGRSRGRRVS